MLLLLFTLLFRLTVQLNGSVENLELVVTNSAGETIRKTVAPTAGKYVFDELEEGTYTIRAVVGNTLVGSLPDVHIPAAELVELAIKTEPVEAAPQPEGARRNQNIQVNLVDTQALIESLGRQGAQVRPIIDFSAVRQNFAAEFGGVGRTPQIARGNNVLRAYHGELYETHNNHTMNARTFFQVGSVLPSRRNQYGFRFGGPLGSDKVSFQINGEELRESGFVNDNVLVPLPRERTSTAEAPAVRAVIQNWLKGYPNKLPNRPEIDQRLLNTNGLQDIRNSGGGFRLDWQRTGQQKLSANYSLADNFIDAFELVAGQNPDQRLRSQTLNLTLEQQVSARTTLRAGVNYLRRKIHVLLPPTSVGPFVNISGIESLGPSFELPIRRVSNDFEYNFQGTTTLTRHLLDWGGSAVRSQLNEYQADAQRGVFSFQSDFGRSGIENFLRGEPSRYTTILGELYRGFRMTNVAVYGNDRIRLRPDLHLTLGLRYEFAGKPLEAHKRTLFKYKSDANNFAPRVGLAWARGASSLRVGYGISFGTVFPATFRVARLNPPDVSWVRLQAPNLIDPLNNAASGVAPLSALNKIDANLVVPYSHQYTLQVSRELPAAVKLTATYLGSRTLKLFRMVRENRAIPVEGIPFTTRTIDLRRPDQATLSVARMTNQARSYFDAGQLSVEKIFARGIAFNATYTWSKAIDTGSDFSSPGTNMQERFAQVESLAFQDLRAVSNFDVPHSFLLGFSAALPTRWLKGWTVSGTTILKDGTPFNVETGTDGPPFGNGDGERGDRPSILTPDLIGVSVDNPDTALGILRRDAFDAQAGSRVGYGNLPRNAFRKDGTTNFNLALSRTFTVSGDRTRTITTRTEFINTFNHPQFSPPNLRLTDEAFGQITGTENAGRLIQFQLRFGF